MITPAVDLDDNIFGFTNNWINKISERADWLYVVTIRKGRVELNNNVDIFSVRDKNSKLSKIIYLQKLFLKLVPKIDLIFTHMHPDFPIWVAPYAKLFGKPIIMWRTHGHIDKKSKLSHILVNRVVTASKNSFRIDSDKITVVGHGIDTDKFTPQYKGDKKIILSVGRISPVKNYEILIKAINIIVNNEGIKNIKVQIVGSVPMKSQEGYFINLKKMVSNYKLDDYVEFLGAVPYTRILPFYRDCSIFVNTSKTGSLDKVVLEAMACEKPVLTSNHAFLDIFDEELKEKCFFNEDGFEELASKIKHFLATDETELKKKLRETVVKYHSLNHLTDSLSDVFREVIG